MTDVVRVPDEHIDAVCALLEDTIAVMAREVAALDEHSGPGDSATVPSRGAFTVATAASRAAIDRLVEYVQGHAIDFNPQLWPARRDPRLGALMEQLVTASRALEHYNPRLAGPTHEEPTDTGKHSSTTVRMSALGTVTTGATTARQAAARTIRSLPTGMASGGTIHPSVPNVFAEGSAPVLSNHATTALMRAIQSSLREWDDANGNSVPTYTMATNKGTGRVTVSVRPAPGESRPSDVLPSLWKTVGELDDLCSDVLLVCLAQWNSLASGPHEAVRITADAILDARGIQRITHDGESGNWQHGHRTEDRIAAGRALAQLAALWLEITNVGTGLKTKLLSRITIESSPALAIVGLREQLDLEGRRVLLDATVMPGDWARTYWELGLRQTAVLAQKALAYDPKYHYAEKRLAKYLAFAFRWNAHKEADTIDPRVSTLLKNASLEPDQRRPQRTRDRLEAALKRLADDGVIGSWSYVINPSTHLPPRGWLTHWLAQTIRIDAPAIVIERYARLKPKRGKLERQVTDLAERIDQLEAGQRDGEI